MFLPDDAPVGMALADYLGDTVLDLDLTPNLARCFSMVGVAREVAALTGSSLRYPGTDWQTAGAPASELARVEIEDPSLCSRYIAAIIRDVEIGPSPQWMQDWVRRAGMRPISNIVDITNFVMLEWGQPLHAFDYDKLVARADGEVPTIIVRRAGDGETMKTLDGVLRTFSDETLLICDTRGPIAVAGVMGGFDTEISEDTRNILLESANFDLVSVRRTTQALKLPSEASARFGRGIHPDLAAPAVRRASELMRVLAGGTIAPGLVDEYPVKPDPVLIDLTTREVERSLGIHFDLEAIASILESLEFNCEPISENALRVTVPDHRLDCEYAADLIEELVRIYGYDRIPLVEMADRLPPQRSNRTLQLEEQVRDILVACGLQEVITYSLTNLEQEAALDPSLAADDLDSDSYITLANPITVERSVMRHSLLVTGLETAAANLRFCHRVEIFEVGKVFLPEAGEELPAEPRRLSMVMTGLRSERHWLETEGPALDFFDLKGVVEALLARLHVTGAVFEPADHPTFQEGRTARILLGHPEKDSEQAVVLGFMGEIDPAVRDGFGLPDSRVAAAELDLDMLLTQVPETWFVEPITPYPAALQDLAVIVEDQVSAGRVEKLIAESGGFLLKDVSLFDVYRGDPVPEGKKSLAFALSFQAPDKTLRDDIVAKQVQRIVQRLKKELGAELRSQ
jgi:phenylalanyl-tRNA synthetase beta chain